MDINYDSNTFNENGGSFLVEEVRNIDLPMGCEDCFKIFFVFSGVLQVTLLGESFEVFGGESVFVFPMQMHSAMSYDGVSCKIISFPSGCCPDFAEMTRGKVQSTGVYRIGDDIDYLESISEELDDFLNKSFLYAILSGYTKKVNLKSNEGKDNDFISRVTLFVQENCTEDISLHILANKLGYGYHYTSALFKKNFKCNFMFFVNQHRIALAEKLLKNRADLSITDIAFECGYGSLRSFGRNFAEIKGVSPREWRSR